MLSALALVAVVLLVLLIACYLGFPLSVALGLAARDPLKVRTALLGICALELLDWHWVTLTGRGVGGFTAVILVANAGPFFWAVRQRWRGGGQLLKGGLAPLAITLAAALVFLRYYYDAMKEQALLPVSLSNNDLPLYALLAQHLQGQGFGDEGAIVGSALGATARSDVFGAFALLGSLSTATHLDVWRVILPAMLGALVLLAGLCAQLVRVGTGLPGRVSGLIGATAISSSMFFYSVGQGFFAQLFGMAIFAALALAVMEHRSIPDKGFVRSAAEVGLLSAGMLLTYPHMAFLGLPLLLVLTVAPVLLRPGATVASTAPQVLLLGAGSVLGACLAGTRTLVAWQRTFSLGEIVAGWGFPRVDVTQYLGLQLFPAGPSLPVGPPRHELALAAISWRTVAAVVVLAVIAALLVRAAAARSRSVSGRAMGWAFTWAAVPTASYYVFYGYFGAGYQQWKWLAFLQPFIVVGVLALLAGLLAENNPWRDRSDTSSAWLQVAALVGVLVVTLSARAQPHVLEVTPALTAIEDDPLLARSTGVNVIAAAPSPYWDGMWAMYFMGSRRVVPLTQSYFPVQPPDPRYPTVRVAADGTVAVLPPSGG